MGKESFSDLWILLKRLFVILSILISLIATIIPFIFENTIQNIIMLSFGIIVFLLSMLLGLAYETQSIILKDSRKQITKIQLNDEFWNHSSKYRRLYLNVLNGDRFIEMMFDSKGIEVDEIKIIVPSLISMQTYFYNDTIVSDPEKSSSTLKESIDNVRSTLSIAKSKGKIKNFEIKYLNTFPLDFYAIFDGKHCLVGKYLKDSTRKHTIGLKSICWVERDYQLVSQYNNHFEDIWENI